MPDGATILDVGCGGGLFLALLASTGTRIDGVGVDVGSSQIALARRMSERFGKDRSVALQFHRLDIRRGWPTASYDVVSMIDVLHHVPPRQREPLIDRAAESIKPGGRFIFKDMCLRPRWRAWMNRLHDMALAREWITYTPIVHVESWITARGLRIIHAEDTSRLWYGHELRVFAKPPT